MSFRWRRIGIRVSLQIFKEPDMQHSDADLLALLGQPESNWLERKKSFTAGTVREKISATVCAFANALADNERPGVLLIGVADDGEVIGIPDTDDVKTGIDEIKSDGRIQPLPSIVTRSVQTVDGKHVMVIIVQPASLPPVRFKGQIFVRMSASTRDGNQEDERILNERRRHRAGRSFDSEGIPHSSIGDLNARYFEDTYLPSAISREILLANGRTLEEKLTTTRMAIGSNPCSPTVAGLLTLGYTPQDWFAGAYVQFVRYAGSEHGGTIADQMEITGNLETVIRQAEEKIKLNILLPTDINSQDREVRSPDYPLAALQQLFRNAVLHRNYEGTNAPIRLYWFDDRVEIMNPGGPFGIVNADNFGHPHVTDYRNPTIAEVLHNLHFVQRFGFGIQNAKSLLRANGNPEPEFAVSASTVVVTVRKTTK